MKISPCLLLFFTLDSLSPLIFTNFSISYTGNGSFTLPYNDLQNAFQDNLNSSSTFFINNDQTMSTTNISSPVDFNFANIMIINNSSKNIPEIIFFQTSFQISGALNFFNVSIILNDSFFNLNGTLSLCFCRIQAYTNIGNSFMGNPLIYMLRSGYVLINSSIFTNDIQKTLERPLFYSEALGVIEITNSIISNFETQILTAIESSVTIDNFSLKNFNSFSTKYFDSLFLLFSSKLQMTNSQIFSISNLSYSFLIFYPLNVDISSNLSIFLGNCSFSDISFTSVNSFIDIAGLKSSKLVFQNLLFSNFVSNYSVIISVENCISNLIFTGFQIFNCSYVIAISVTNSLAVNISDSFFLSNNPLNMQNIDSTAIVFLDVSEKMVSNLSLINCVSYISTPGIKVLSTLDTSSKLVINSSFFSNNRVYYAKENEVGVVFYIFADFETVSLIDSYFLSNFIVPSTSVDQIGSPCLRVSGFFLNCTIFQSIFRNNQAVFGSNAIFFSGKNLYINCSLFDSNTNLLPVKDKYVIETFGYGGSVLSLSEQFTILDCIFKYNMNYFGGNIYIKYNSYNSKSVLIVLNSKFIDNYSHTFGAGFFLESGLRSVTANFSNSLFFRNWANYNGAGAQLGGTSKIASTMFNNCDFLENWSYFGPAINYESQLSYHYIQNCHFYNNTATFLPRDKNKYAYSFPANGGSGGVFSMIIKAGPTMPTLYLENNSFIENSAFCKGGVAVTMGGILIDKNSRFIRNKAAMAGTFHMHLDTYLYLENSTIIESHAFITYSCIVISDESFAVFDSVSFINCSGGEYGLLMISSECQVEIRNCIYNNLSATRGSILSSKGNGKSEILIRNNIFDGTLGNIGKELFYFDNSALIRFEDNIVSNYSTSIFTLVNVNFIIKNTMITNVNCINSNVGFVLNANKNSTINIENVTFNNVYTKDEGIFIISNSNLTMNRSIIINVFNVQGGSVLFCKSGFITFSNSHLENSFSSFIMVTLSELNVFNSTFLNQNLNRSFFSAFQKTTKSIFSFIIVYDSIKTSISNSTFLSNPKAINGSALTFICNSLYNFHTVYFNYFFNNSATNSGGAIYVQDCPVLLDSNEFRNNSAFSGGAIFSWNIFIGLNLSNNIFIFNRAHEGGAIKYTNVNPSYDSSNIFQSNNAFYGKNFAAFPIQLKNLNGTSILEGRPSFSSSVFQNFDIAFVDELGQVVGSYNDSQITVELYTLDLNLVSEKEIKLTGTTTVGTIFGQAFFNDIYFSMNFTNATLYFKFSSDDVRFPNLNINFTLSEGYSSSSGAYYLKIPLVLTSCKTGEVFDQHLQICLPCSKGTYSLNPAAKECSLCPSEADYCIAADISLKSGFWRSNLLSNKILKCLPYGLSCPGGVNVSCEEGYRGPLCQSCDIGEKIYSKYFGVECLVCSDSKIVILIRLIAGSVCLIGFYIMVIYSNIKLIDALEVDENAKRIKENSLEKFYPPIFNKILVDYIQVISLIKDLDLDWPSEISDFFQIHYMAGNAPAYLYSFDCLVGKDAMIPSIYLKTIMITITPIICFLLQKIFWSIYQKVKGVNMNYKYITSRLVVSNLLLPTIVNISSKILACQNVEGTQYIKSDLYYECYSKDNVFYMFVFAVPTLVFWIILYPSINFCRLYMNKDVLYTENLRKRYGFLYNSYKTKYYYWELIIINKKFFLIFIISFLQINIQTKALIVLCFMYAYSYYLVKKFPFITKPINKLAFTSDVVSVSTIFIALLSFSIESPFLTFLTVAIIVLGNAVFLTMFVWRVFKIYRKKFVTLMRTFPFLNKKFFQTTLMTERKSKIDGFTLNLDSKSNMDSGTMKRFMDSKINEAPNLKSKFRDLKNVKVINIT